MFFVILFVSVIVLIVISCRGYYNFFKEKKHGKILFLLIFIMLIANLFIAVKKSKIIPFRSIKNISFFLGALTFITLIYSSFFFIIKRIIIKIAERLNKSGKFIKFLNSAGKSAAVIFSAMILITIMGYINMSTLKQTDYIVNVEKKSSSSQLNCAIISDTHIGVGLSSDKLNELVDKINGINPDVILMVGDIVDESTSDDDIKKMVNAFKNLKSKKGIFYVSGNHEKYGGFNYDKYMKYAGITVLDDKAVTIDNDITIIGRKDRYTQRKELKQIIEDQNVDTQKPVIVLNHEPLELEKMVEEGADITISGHTHGEQFPLTKKLFSMANDMMYGTKKIGNSTAVTTSGTAGWGLHFKLPAKSEIVNLKIKFK